MENKCKPYLNLNLQKTTMPKPEYMWIKHYWFSHKHIIGNHNIAVMQTDHSAIIRVTKKCLILALLNMKSVIWPWQ